MVGATSLGTIAGCTDDSGTDESGAVEGDAQAAASGVELEVKEVTLSHKLVTDEDESYVPDPGNLFLFLKIESRNAGDEIVNLAHRRELRVIVGDEQFEPLKVSEGFTESVPDGYTEPMRGDTYETVSDARPDVASSGILAFEIPADAEQAELTWAREFEQEKPLYWTLSLNPDSVPQFEIQEIKVPNEAEYYSEFQVELRVRNDGGAGLFDRGILVEPTEDYYELNRQIGAGETVTITQTIEYPGQEYELTEEATIRTIFKEQTVSFVTPTREVGEFYTGPDGLKITISDYRLTDYAAREGAWDTPVEYTPDSGEDLLLVEFTIENTDSTSRVIPRNSNVTLQTEDGEHDITVEHPTSFSGDKAFVEPFRADVITENQISPGEYIEGWTLYRIPQGTNLRESYLKWSRDTWKEVKYDDLQARWSL